MDIAICEDNSACMEDIKRFLDGHSEFTATYYATGDAFLNAIENGCVYEIILLDIKLPDILGTRIAAKLKTLLPHADIVFISSYPQYVTAAFSLHVTQFLVKPLREKLLLQELRKIVQHRQTENVPWCIRTKNATYRLLPSEIIYVEAYYRHLHIQTIDQSITICGKLSDAKKALSQSCFYPCHQGFLVNMNYVRRIDMKEVVCGADFHIPISYRKRHEFLEAYSKFLEG